MRKGCPQYINISGEMQVIRETFEESEIDRKKTGGGKKRDRRQNDFSTGSVSGHILSLAVPMTVAQLVQVLYNIVDRIYIGHLPARLPWL